MKLNLQQFAGGHSVTVVKGDNVTTATASSDTDVAKDAEVTLTVAVASGYEPVYETIAGGVEVDPATKKFTMGEKDVVLAVKAKANNLYRVLETTMATINNTTVNLVKNVVIRYGKNGAIAEAGTEGTTITSAGVIAALLDAGLIEKI